MAYEIPILDLSETCVAAVTQYRVVRINGAGVAMSTATPVLARVLGVAQAAGTTVNTIPIRVLGVTKVEASTAAITRGAYVSPTSGAGSTGNTQLGGTVKATTAQVVSIGVALTSAAAAAAGNKRYISVLLRL
jgi:hypothetical protein